MPALPTITPPEWLLDLSVAITRLPAIEQTPLPQLSTPGWLLSLSDGYANMPTVEQTPLPQPVPPDWLMKLSPRMARFSAAQADQAESEIEAPEAKVIDISLPPTFAPATSTRPTPVPQQAEAWQRALTPLPFPSTSGAGYIADEPQHFSPPAKTQGSQSANGVHVNTAQARAQSLAPAPPLLSISAYEPFAANRKMSSTGEVLLGCGVLLVLGVLALILLYYLAM